jgi:calcium-dependent protein kinase
MHSNNFVHRDINPNNILVGSNLTYLIDFDSAAHLHNTMYPIQKGYVGTPYYMAPEIWNQIDDLDYKLADIYSLGVVMYFIFNNKHLPYVASNIEGLEYQVTNEKPRVSKHQNEKLNMLIMSIIDKDPKNRPSIQNIRENLFIPIQL